MKKLSQAAEDRLDEIVKRYPHSKSAVMPALYIAQEEYGWVTDAAVQWVAERLNLPPAHIREVATFYTMYYKAPVGKYHVQVCRTLSCMLCGAREITEALKKRFGVNAAEVTPDGMWSFEEVECLGSCGTGPMVQINDVFFEALTVDKLHAILDRVEREKPNLRFSTTRQDLGKGLPDLPRSQVYVPITGSAS